MKRGKGTDRTPLKAPFAVGSSRKETGIGFRFVFEFGWEDNTEPRARNPSPHVVASSLAPSPAADGILYTGYWREVLHDPYTPWPGFVARPHLPQTQSMSKSTPDYPFGPIRSPVCSTVLS